MDIPRILIIIGATSGLTFCLYALISGIARKECNFSGRPPQKPLPPRIDQRARERIADAIEILDEDTDWLNYTYSQNNEIGQSEK
jgi:hypothetical protein